MNTRYRRQRGQKETAEWRIRLQDRVQRLLYSRTCNAKMLRKHACERMSSESEKERMQVGRHSCGSGDTCKESEAHACDRAKVRATRERRSRREGIEGERREARRYELEG